MARIDYLSICGTCNGLDWKHYEGCVKHDPLYPAVFSVENDEPVLISEYENGTEKIDQTTIMLREGEHEMNKVNFNDPSTHLGAVWMIGKCPGGKIMDTKIVKFTVPNAIKKELADYGGQPV